MNISQSPAAFNLPSFIRQLHCAYFAALCGGIGFNKNGSSRGHSPGAGEIDDEELDVKAASAETESYHGISAL